jgi:hypothetical protein
MVVEQCKLGAVADRRRLAAAAGGLGLVLGGAIELPSLGSPEAGQPSPTRISLGLSTPV